MSSRLSVFTRRLLNASKWKGTDRNIGSKRMYSDDHHVTKFGDHFFFDVSNHRSLAIKFTLFFASSVWLPWFVVWYHLTKGGGEQKDQKAPEKPAKGKAAKAAA